MEFESKIVVDKDIDILYTCFNADQKNWSRAKLILKKKEDRLELDIKANDATALKSMRNTQLGLLLVYEKIINLLKKHKN